MIAKGTTHNNGAKLAAYMTTGKDGERAELWQLRGFEAPDIKDSFRDVHIMAGATRCEQPFFHLQLRNREGETLTRPQWELAADRIEKMLGLDGQPRAIAFHTYEHNGDEHMHIAWSRIDEDTLTAKPLPFFKERLKRISRELEIHFALEPVTSERKGNIKFAPTRAEHEQARRLGLDIHEIRDTIRSCFERSDCGISFRAALEQEGLALAQGERRDFVVIDQAGGLHALGKRILDVTAAKIRDRLSDLSRDELPSIEVARALAMDTQQARKQEAKKVETSRDRDFADRSNTVIENEKQEQQFVHPDDREKRAGNRKAGKGRREKKWPVMPPMPEPIRTSPAYHFEDAARAATGDRNVTPPKALTGMSARIMGLLEELRKHPERVPADSEHLPIKMRTFAAVLDDKGIALAKVTKVEADRSHREAEFARALGNYAPRFKESEIVAVTEPPLEYRRNGEIVEPRRVHKLDQKAAKEFVAVLAVPHKEIPLQGIDATKKALDNRAQQRAADWAKIRFERATTIRAAAPGIAVNDLKPAKALGKTALRAMAKTLDGVGNAVESLFAPKLSPEQIHDSRQAARQRQAEGESAIDFSRYTTARAAGEQAQEQQREVARQRERDDRER